MSTPVISFCWDQIHFLVDQASNNSKFGFLDVQERSMIRSCFRIKTIYLKDFTWQWPQQWLFSVQVWLWWDWSAPRRWKVGVEEEEMRWKAMWWSTGSSWGKDRHTWFGYNNIDMMSLVSPQPAMKSNWNISGSTQAYQQVLAVTQKYQNIVNQINCN